MGNIYSFFRRNIINEGDVYNVKDLFGGLIKEEGNQITIDDPEFGLHQTLIWVVNCILFIVL
jgi:hypothetical protein